MIQDTITLLIADDHPIFRTGLREVLESEEGFTVVAEAGDGESAVAKILSHKPRAAILDIEMPGMNGLDAIDRLNAENSSVPLIILTMYKEETIFNRAMEAGVMGYVLKDSAAIDLVRAIRAVVSGEYFVSPALTQSALRSARVLDQTIGQKLGLQSLTPTEQKVLHFISLGKSSKQIGEAMNVSPRTIDNHRYNITRKLNLSGGYGLLKFAMENREYL